MSEFSFYRGKKVFLTGHTGFKGAWLSYLLLREGADVTGYSLEPPTKPSLFTLLGLQDEMLSIEADVRNLVTLHEAFAKVRPEIVIHMAAQPIVREAYRNPVVTYETNVIGTVNLLECIRNVRSVRSCLNVTTDKVYENREWVWGYRESDSLGGFDPYSNSKSCSELVTQSYRNSYFTDGQIALSTARAGNVIGGGDFAIDRVIPDCVRATVAGGTIIVRHPESTRPYQHVLESLRAYLIIASRQYEDVRYAGCYNVGPDEGGYISTGDLVEMFCAKWGSGARWESRPDNGPHEAGFLKLDCSKMQSVFGWKPRWGVERAVEKSCDWTKAWIAGEQLERIMRQQLEDYSGDPR